MRQMGNAVRLGAPIGNRLHQTITDNKINLYILVKVPFLVFLNPPLLKPCGSVLPRAPGLYNSERSLFSLSPNLPLDNSARAPEGNAWHTQ